ncbi:MAG: GspMb/PilO family protein [Candidatus Acidiferrales bacterium]
MKISLWPAWKKGFAMVLCLLVAADVALIVVLWQIGREGPQAMRGRMMRLTEESKFLRADVARGQKIRASMPNSGRECDAFYNKAFFDSTTGYSQIEADLNSISKDAGVQTSGLKFKQKEVKGRGVMEVDVATTVTADYPSLIHFINGLERSQDFYLLDGLALHSSQSGLVDLDLSLHTYFRT